MRRRTFMQTLAGALFGATAARAFAEADFPPLTNRGMPWQRVIDPERFEILFKEETEWAGSSPLNDEKRDGTYICAACYLPLFRSEHKYDSGTGWPSFTQPIEGHIATREDRRGRTPIIEYHCARCGGHQGHVFDDGPAPRGERWCNNGLAVEFIPKGTALPALRG
jgi:peptide-methionine (R)-S-oxide reductase